MSIYGNCDNIYNTNLTNNDLCNVPHYKGKEPYGDYNALGELQGYFWYYGETIRLKFDIEGEITIDQQVNGNNIYTTVVEYLQDKIAKVKIYNFRYEEIYSKDLPATNIVVDFDHETSKKFIRGTYYLTLSIMSEDGMICINVPLIVGNDGETRDCVITVR